MAITLTEAQEQVTAWKAASLALAKGLSFSMNGRALTRTDADEVRKMIAYWSRIEANILSGQQSGRDRSRTTPGLVRFS